MFLFTIDAFVSPGFQRPEGDDPDQVAKNSCLFGDQVASARRAAYPDNSTLNDYLVKIQQCHIGSKNRLAGKRPEINGMDRSG